VLQFGELEIDLLNRRVRAGVTEIRLTSLEQRLLYLLAANAGRVLTRDEIMDHLWGNDFAAGSTRRRPPACATCARSSGTAGGAPLHRHRPRPGATASCPRRRTRGGPLHACPRDAASPDPGPTSGAASGAAHSSRHSATAVGVTLSWCDTQLVV
jgi:hypothetical protein